MGNVNMMCHKCKKIWYTTVEIFEHKDPAMFRRQNHRSPNVCECGTHKKSWSEVILIKNQWFNKNEAFEVKQ